MRKDRRRNEVSMKSIAHLLARGRLCRAAVSGLSDVVTPKVNTKDTLHGAEDLLVGFGSATLVVGDDGRELVDSGGQVLLGHRSALLVRLLGSAFTNGRGDSRRNGSDLHNVIGAVNLGEVLTLNSTTLL